MMEAVIAFTKGVIGTHGYLGLFVLTFTEQFIFPVPADMFIAMGTSLGLVMDKMIVLILIATLVGSCIGYFLGKWLGHPAAKWLFGEKNMAKGEAFMKKWGIWGVIIGGATPLPYKIFTWTAGIFEMPLGKFILGVIIGRLPRYILVAYAGNWFLETKFYATTYMSAVILGALQGITEFLPISSSGHLILMERFLKLPLDATLMQYFDIILHGGSLLAILLYFWKDWLSVLMGVWNFLKTRRIAADSLVAMLAFGTIPAIFAGLVFNGFIGGPLRNTTSIAVLFLCLAAFYLLAEWRSKKSHGEKVTLKKAVLIGCAQAVSLIPGISRSGLTIGVGMLTGLKRDVAAKFSFMLGGVAILAANVYGLVSLGNGALLPDLKFTLIGFTVSFVVSLCAIAWLLKYLHKHTLRAFSFYLILIGILVLSFL